jgi:hypothetical protein
MNFIELRGYFDRRVVVTFKGSGAFELTQPHRLASIGRNTIHSTLSLLVVTLVAIVHFIDQNETYVA